MRRHIPFFLLLVFVFFACLFTGEAIRYRFQKL
jgi:hypothetical protein